MVPNADPIPLSGNANFGLKNAQFVAIQPRAGQQQHRH